MDTRLPSSPRVSLGVLAARRGDLVARHDDALKQNYWGMNACLACPEGSDSWRLCCGLSGCCRVCVRLPTVAPPPIQKRKACTGFGDGAPGRWGALATPHGPRAPPPGGCRRARRASAATH
eukprot:4314730-Prymnesium_polylepis.1